MTRLRLFYDDRCGLCSTLKDWLGQQRQLIPLECVPKLQGREDLMVVADTGEIWEGNAAWIIVLWALADYRKWSYRLARPPLLAMARQAFATISHNRKQLSDWLALRGDHEVARHLHDVPLPASCETQL